jgi:pyruvate dehydrogenase E2 component (dihydrolipoamide acetyltransferase)
MATLLPMPEVVAGATDAVLSHWLVGENAPFSVGDPIAVIETEKAAVDLEAEADARLVRSLVADGASVTVGMPLAVLAEPGEQIDDVDALLVELGVTTAGAAPAAESPEVAEAREDPPAAGSARPGERVFASPLVRRLSRQHRLDLATITGTGPNGRIVRRDVEAVLAAASSGGNGSGPAAGGAPAETPPAASQPSPAPVAVPPAAEQIPHTRVRRAIARRLVESKQQIPHFYLKGSARVDALLALRAQVNEVSPARVSVNDFLLKAAAVAHTRIPEMNVVWSDDGLLRFPTVDIGVAVASRRGLVTPVVRSVESASLSSIAGRVKDYAARADEGGLGQHELEGGTLTISNLGMFGAEEFSAIINPPQAAILAVGAGRREPVVDEDGAVGSATVLRVVLSADHRAVDGALAARWMAEFVRAVENPLVMLV